MSTHWPKLLLIFVLLATGRCGLSADNKHDLPRLERSFWLHASLTPTAQKGYWGPAYPASPSPTEPDIQNAAKLLTGMGAVQDTWSGFCHGKTNTNWLDKGFGAETLRKWVENRNQQSYPVAWDLIVVAWDYSATERGGYPGYDDAAKNMPLPAGRNRLAAQEILQTGRVGCVAGFSSDLLILQANSEHPAHDGRQASFYETLKRGEPYQGYYAVPFREIVDIYSGLKDGKSPDGK